ncbi:DHA2 family efflux MFS transporter permease subunit [Streptomyces sp. NPDC057245]|uniref:Alp1R family transporter n=1 Tax=Streptomyces sp. FXJ8.102 TaxID=1581323 RepID=A0A7L4WP08_9ACTN|nr:DHA2 family efflux MFS transporter permease subunit [Streptomyces sp. A108]MBU6533791.1 DHA2 family efflux MFS transporter permease subunit [Streptomyces sp. A108]QFS19051.1 Alp1R family transporter [Streptomyces sp. FXJ8.102]
MSEQSLGQAHASPSASPPAGAATGSPSRKGLALTAIAVAQLMVVLDVSIVNVALPSIQSALDFSATNLEWVVNAYALAFGGLLLLGGRIADMYGQRRTLLFGIGLLTVSSLLGGLATNQGWLIGARAVQGVAGALIAPAALALIASTFSEGAERNKAMGIYAAMGGAGGALGNVLGGVFTDALSWRWVLFVNVPIGVLLLLAAVKAFPAERVTTGGRRLDLPGAVTSTVGMSLVVYGLIHAATDDWGSAGTVLPLAVGAALLAVFLFIEFRTDSPLMPPSIFRNRNRSGAYAIMLALGAGMIALFYFLTLFMQIVLGFSPLKTGFAFLPFAVGAAVFATISSQVVGRVGPRILLGAGTLLAAVAFFWFSQLSENGSYSGDLLGPLSLAGCSVGLCFVPLTLAAVAGVRKAQAGVSSALLNAGQQVGAALGLAALGTVAISATKDRLTELMGAAAAESAEGYGPADAANMPPEVRKAVFDSLAQGYGTAFMVAGFVLLGAFVLAVLVLRVSSKDAEDAEMGVVI